MDATLKRMQEYIRKADDVDLTNIGEFHKAVWAMVRKERHRRETAAAGMEDNHYVVLGEGG